MNDFEQPPLLEGPPPRPLLPAPDRDAPESPQSDPTGRGGSGRRLLGLGVFLLFTAALALGVWRHYEKHRQVIDNAEQRANFVPSVRVEAVAQRFGRLHVTLPATTLAFEAANIYARASGYVLQRYVDIGDHVKAGQLLAEITAPEVEAQVAQYQNSLQQAQATVRQNEAQRASTDVTSKRISVLAKDSWATQELADTDRYNFQAQQHATTAAEYNAAATEQQLKYYNQQKIYQQVVAPFDGVITQRNIDVGSLITADAAGGTSMFSLTHSDVIRVWVYVPQDSAFGVKATASYCTSFGDLHGDGNEPSWVRRFSAAAPQDGLVGRQLPEATLQLVLVELRDQSLAAPLLDGGFGDAEAGGDLPSGQHAEAAQPLIPAGQLIGGADEGDLLQVEGLRFPSPAAALVEDVGDLAIAVPVEEPIDLGDELGLELADLRNRQRPFEPQAASGAATQADMGGDHLGLDQGHVLDKQAQDPLAVARLDARIVPNRRELFG